MLAIEFKLYAYSRYKKRIKFINKLTKYVNAYQISNFLLYCQFLKPKLVLDYNTTNFLDLLLDNNKKNISSKRSNNSKKSIKVIDKNNNKKYIISADINK